jgi:dihydrodipicolinate synthase/N-acetylneuraminate lyase
MPRQEALSILQQGTVIPAAPLALDEHRKFDEHRQRTLVRYYMDSGSGGMAIGVHTTQFEIRKPEHNLLEPVLSTVSEEIGRFEQATSKTIVKVAGACGETKQALAEAALAKNLGFDAVLLSPGGLTHLSEAEMIDRTKAVAEVMPVIGFYLQPSVGGRAFSYNYWARVAEISNVVAMKAAPFNRYATLDLVRAVAMSSRHDQIALYTGNDDNIVVDLLTQYRFTKDGQIVTKEFVGGLLGHWSVWTRRAVELLERVKCRKDIAEILALANEITDANSVIFDAANGFRGCIPGIHEVLRRQGLLQGIWCLDPHETLSPGQAKEIDRIYHQYPHLHDDDFVKENLDTWLAQSGTECSRQQPSHLVGAASGYPEVAGRERLPINR